MTSVYEQRPWLKQYPPDIPASQDIPDKSLIDAFDEATEKWSKNTAIIFYGRKIKYGELRKKVDCFANALFDLGIGKGDRVALLLLNSPEHIIAFYAVLKVGAIISSVSPVYVSSEIKHQLDDGEVEYIICQDMLYDVVEKTGIKFRHVILTNISDSLPKMKKIFGKSILRSVYQNMAVPPSKIYEQKNFHQFQDLLKRYTPHPPKIVINPTEDVATLQYTGGTTGPPKGVMTTHYSAIAGDYNYQSFFPCINDGKEVVLAYMPFYHAGGQTNALIGGILHGYNLVILTTPDIDDILNAISRYQITLFLGAPAIFEILNDHEKTNRVNWKKLKLIISGTDSLMETTARSWKKRTGVPIHEIYGMTETMIINGNPLGKSRFGSVGLPVTNVRTAILDPDKDRFLDIGEMGEIGVSSPQITKGYWQNKAATRDCEALIEDITWWRTGDLGKMEEDGYFYIYDRKRDLIKYKGLRVYAREVEEILKTHPKIKEVGIIGVPDIKVGERVKAMVVLESDARGMISEQDIMEYCNEKIAPYKIPKIVEFIGEIPKTDVGKVSRRELREIDV